MTITPPSGPSTPVRLPDVFPPPRAQAVLPDLPGALEHNLLPISALTAPLVVEFDQWALAPVNPSDPPAQVFYYWNDAELGSKTFSYPFDPGQLFFEVPVAALQEGIHRLKYRITSFLADDDSKIAEVTIDRSAPYGNSTPLAPRLPVDVGAGGIDDAYLASHGDQVLITVDAYLDCKPYDVIELFWRNLSPLPGDEAVAARLVVPQGAGIGPFEVVVLGDVVRARRNGAKSLKYYIRDRAGNASVDSRETYVSVNVTAPPSLAPPRVPALDDGLVTRSDVIVNPGVEVLIDPYDHQVGDSISVDWGGQVMVQVPVEPNPSFPLRRQIPWDVLAVGDHFERPHDVDVTYTVVRAAQRWTSVELEVAVDFSVAGPPNPAIDPINSRLPLVTVKGVTGDNVITLADANQPVRVEVLLYANPQPGEKLDLFWGGLVGDAPVATYTVQAGDVAGKLIVFAVLWADVLAGGGGLGVPVRYTTFNGINGQQCQDTLCRVEVAVEDRALPVPFYPDPNAPKFTAGPEETWNPIIANYNCAAHPWRGVVIRIPASDRFVANSRIVLGWRGYSTSNLAESSFLPGTLYQEERVITAATEKQEVSFTIPPADFRRCILPTSYRGQGEGQRTPGSGYAFYTLYSPGLPAVHNEHKQSYCRIDLIRPGANCPCSWDGYPTEEEDWCLDCDPITDGACAPQP